MKKYNYEQTVDLTEMEVVDCCAICKHYRVNEEEGRFCTAKKYILLQFEREIVKDRRTLPYLICGEYERLSRISGIKKD